MKRTSVLFAFPILVLGLRFFADDTLAQSKAGVNPTSTPAPKRRTFDQFDLSDGIRIGSSSSRGGANSAPAVTEFVDQSTYEGIARMVRYAESIESEYRSTESVTVDPSDYFEPYRVLSRKLPALLRISEMFRAGVLDQPVLKDPANVALLNQNQQIISEMMMIVNSTEAQLARNQPKLLPLAEKYGARTSPVEKRPLLTGMFTRLNASFRTLETQVVLLKR